MPLSQIIYKEIKVRIIFMYEISSQASFSAAHHLLNYNGPCENVHGHNWTVRAIVKCEKLNDLGLGIDFKVIKAALAETVKMLDHSDLNIIFDPLSINPSSENIAEYIFKKLEPRINNNSCSVFKVEVSETPGNTAAYYR
jgi:6-pyruvoyltetrahydropterin/6-carboxytetrahydropterin synthase